MSVRSFARKSISKLIPRKLGFDRTDMFHHAWGHVANNHLRGDYVEIGVYSGASLILSYQQQVKFLQWNQSQLKSKESWRRALSREYSDFFPHFYGFDTFRGIPKNDEKNDIYAEGNYAMDFKEVQDIVSRRVPDNCFTLIPGDICALEVLPNFKNEKIAVLHIDSDLYRSALSALRLAKNKLQIGSVILFDDYHGFQASDEKGERKALNEFLNESGCTLDRWMDYSFAGRSFLVTKLPQ